MMKNINSEYRIMKVVSGFLIILVSVLGSFLYIEKKENHKLTRDMDYINSEYLSKNGGTSLYNKDGEIISYNMKSWDGGKIWYACEYGDNWELIILGEAETIYPGLMNHLIALDSLTSHIENKGPLFSNGYNEKEAVILRNVGLTVSQKK